MRELGCKKSRGIFLLLGFFSLDALPLSRFSLSLSLSLDLQRSELGTDNSLSETKFVLLQTEQKQTKMQRPCLLLPLVLQPPHTFAFSSSFFFFFASSSPRFTISSTRSTAAVELSPATYVS